MDYEETPWSTGADLCQSRLSGSFLPFAFIVEGNLDAERTQPTDMRLDGLVAYVFHSPTLLLVIVFKDNCIEPPKNRKHFYLNISL